MPSGSRAPRAAGLPDAIEAAAPSRRGAEAFDDAVHALRTAETIRTRCDAIADAVRDGASPHFRIDPSRLDDAAAYVAASTRARYPDLATIPVHSRWRHFEAGGVDRKALLDARLAGRSTADVARARIDLALVSVLLDAGAGPAWSYRSDGATFTRSEGLAVASFDAFVDGRFSSRPDDPHRVDAAALARIDEAALAAVLQVDARNPLVGLDGRVALLHRLAHVLAHDVDRFGIDARPGALFDGMTASGRPSIDAADLLRFLLDAFSDIWPSGQRLDGIAIGDVWPHPHASGSGSSAGVVPFHKLSQWLAYSLVEPFEWAGVRVDALDALTGLPEYRNGGLLIDTGVLVPCDASTLARPMTPADPWIVEWRALTVALLDELAPRVRTLLGRDASSLSLAHILEGGTWAAGRAIAHEKRRGGPPPVTVVSDGTIF